MARYFFHLHNDIDSIDEEGRELADIGEARRCAELDARHMAAESVRHGSLNLAHYVDVTDEHAVPVLRVTFGEVVTILNDFGASQAGEESS